MTLLPVPSRTLDVPTDYGTVRVYEFRPPTPPAVDVRSLPPERAADTPILLLPGRSSGVPMWSANLPGLVARRTVYALDALGDAGLGTQTRAIRDGDDQAAWLDQVVQALGVTRIHLVGHSFGGALAAGYAFRHPERIATLTLLEPVLVFEGLRWQVYVRATVASLPLLPQRWRSSALARLGGADEVDLDDPLARMISDAAAGYAAVLPVQRRPDVGTLRALAVPVYVAMAGNSPMHDARAAVDVACATVPDVRAELWPGTTHSLPMEAPDRVDAAMLAFMAEHEEDARAAPDPGRGRMFGSREHPRHGRRGARRRT
jgi:pimeloyl-ACP methyl ester carboxylesterase